MNSKMKMKSEEEKNEDFCYLFKIFQFIFFLNFAPQNYALNLRFKRLKCAYYNPWCEIVRKFAFDEALISETVISYMNFHEQTSNKNEILKTFVSKLPKLK